MGSLVHGVLNHDESSARKTDFLYRVSLKCLVRNSQDEILAVKEAGRENWDLPGGGMDHGEDIKSAIAREIKEEVGFFGHFEYRIIDIEEPGLIKSLGIWQIRLIFEVIPENFDFAAGDDADIVAFQNPEDLRISTHPVERRIYRYYDIARSYNFSRTN